MKNALHTRSARFLMAVSALFAGAALMSGPALAAGDAAAGEKVFKKCAVCHAVGPKAHNKVGPNLNGVIGRKAGTEKGYNYSKAMKASGLTWTPANITKYVQNPKATVPGNKMAFAGLKTQADINNLLAYLGTFKADGSKK